MSEFLREEITNWLWKNVVMQGASDADFVDEDDQLVDVIRPTPNEIAQFPELDQFDEIHVWSDNYGFKYAKGVNHAE